MALVPAILYKDEIKKQILYHAYDTAHNAIAYFRIFQINLIVLQILQMLLFLVYLS